MPGINDPNYEPPGSVAGNAAEAWYNNVIVKNPDTYDTRIPKAQWLAWYPLWNGSGFTSSKVDVNGKPITGTFANPDMCPDGTQAFGQNMCAPPGYKQGAPTDTSSSTAAPTPPAPSRPMTLQDVLTNMFTQRSSIFGLPGGRDPSTGNYAGTLGIDQYGNPLPVQPNLQDLSLPGGGLLWGSDVSSYGTPTPQTATPAAPKTQDPSQIVTWQQGPPLPNRVGPLSTTGSKTQTDTAIPPPTPPPGNTFRNSSFTGDNPFNTVNRATPTGVNPVLPTSLDEVLTGSTMFKRKKPLSPLATAIGGSSTGSATAGL